MSEADVLYSEVKFTKEKGNTDGTASSPPGPAVRILSTQPSSELSGSQQQLVSNGRSKVTWERVLLVVLGVLLAAAVIALGLTSYKNMELTQKLDAVGRNLTAHKELLQNLTDKLDGLGKVTDDSRPQCEEGWEQRGGECYYFSTDTATWEESRRECKCRGGNLVKIDSREEQEFLQGELRGNMRRNHKYLWIGLTDSKEEGTWLWADGSPLDPSLVFWRPRNPDNFNGNNGEYPDGEDCAIMWANNGVEDLNSWADQPCGVSHRYICDKPAQTSHLKCV